MRHTKISIILSACALVVAMTATPAQAKKNFFKNIFSDSDEEKVEETTVGKVEKNKETKTTEKEEVQSTKSGNETLDDLYNRSLEENINNPKVGNQKAKIREYQNIQAKKLINSKYNAETFRNGEVVIVTIPASDLFYPNETALKPTAGKVLRKFVEFLNVRDFYRMILAMHSDNTGSEEYTENLTSMRVVAVLEWFKKEVTKNKDGVYQNTPESQAKADYIIPYAMGASDPLPDTPNNSVDNREKNRRLEIYLVPGKQMIKKASKGQL